VGDLRVGDLRVGEVCSTFTLVVVGVVLVEVEGCGSAAAGVAGSSGSSLIFLPPCRRPPLEDLFFFFMSHTWKNNELISIKKNVPFIIVTL